MRTTAYFTLFGYIFGCKILDLKILSVACVNEVRNIRYGQYKKEWFSFYTTQVMTIRMIRSFLHKSDKLKLNFVEVHFILLIIVK